MGEDDVCCEFDPEGDSDPPNFRRVCQSCQYVYWSLHCKHDGHQKSCPGCGEYPEPVAEG